MRLNKLHLTNFRSYSKLECEFPTGVITFIGANGAGKTNIVEALIYLSFLTSHRVSTNQPLLKLPSDQAVIRTEISQNERTLTVDLEINSSKANRAKINGNPTKSQREILGALQTLYFSPEDLDLVRGEPGNRRDFLDKLLVMKAPRFNAVISDYERIVKQRNTLLKTRAPQTALEPWNEQLIRFGAELSTARLELTTNLNPYVAQHYKTLNEVKPASILYKSSTPDISTNVAETERALTTRLSEIHHQEIERGVSLVGPHRDDLELHLGDFPAKGYASHGESWSFALSLKLGAFDFLRNQGSTPILILDDVFAELDTTRRAHLVEATKIAEQTFITAAVESDLPPDLHTTKFYVTPGEVSRG